MQKAKLNRPYVETDEKICRGSPVIKGTGMRIVDIVVEYEYLGRTPDEIINAHPYLKLEQVHDAISHYYENRKEIDEKIRSDKQFIREISKTQGAGS